MIVGIGTDRVSSFVIYWGDGTSFGYAGNGVKTQVYATPGRVFRRSDLVLLDGFDIGNVAFDGGICVG